MRSGVRPSLYIRLSKIYIARNWSRSGHHAEPPAPRSLRSVSVITRLGANCTEPDSPSTSRATVTGTLSRPTTRSGRPAGTEVSAGQSSQGLVPSGFAHGCCSREPDTEVIYKVTNYYSPEHDRGVLWSDPDLGIEWPVSAEGAFLSDKDKNQPRLAELPAVFD